MGGTYRDLIAWQKAMDLVTEVYKVTATFPGAETYGLTSQIRRAAVSVPSNIAEGKGRTSDKELTQFLARARGSLCEVETQLEIAGRLGYTSHSDTDNLLRKCAEVGRLINGLVHVFRRDRPLAGEAD